MPRFISLDGTFYGIWRLASGTTGNNVPAVIKTATVTSKINTVHEELLKEKA